MTTLLLPAAFQDGDILSATRLNDLLNSIDKLYGYHFSVNTGGDGQQTPVGYGDGVWSGWVVLHGNQLKFRVTSDGTNTLTVLFDNVTVATLPAVTTGTKTVALDIAGNGWNNWQPYNVRFRFDGDGTVTVDQVYMTQDALGIIGSFPAFTNSTTSDAGDFNAIINGISTLAPVILQPVAGIHGAVEDYAHEWRIQHRCASLRVIATVTGDRDGDTTLNVIYNGTNIGAFTAHGSEIVRVDEYITAPAGLTNGFFYRLRTSQTGPGTANVAMICEEQLDTFGTYGAGTRWTHGDYAEGDSGGPPKLVTLSTNLEAVYDERVWTNWVQREPCSIFTGQHIEPQWWRHYHIRRWRWLAWAQQEFDDEPTATIHWTYDNGVTWQAYTLPTVEGQAYFDLDSSPVQPGMLFYVVGALYAIQTPYTHD